MVPPLHESLLHLSRISSTLEASLRVFVMVFSLEIGLRGFGRNRVLRAVGAVKGSTCTLSTSSGGG